MHSSQNDQDLLATSVSPDTEGLSISLRDGRHFYVPFAKVKSLSTATKQQREHFRLIADGDGIHWPELDEDLSIAGLFRDFAPGNHHKSLSEIPQLIADLYRTTQRLGDLFSGRPFTPDGHLVGSIGEVVAEYIYDLELEACSTPQVDARTRYSSQTVQIKLTGKQGKSYGFRWSNATELKAPDLLICLKLTDLGFEEVYAGEFPIDLLEGRADSTNGQLAIGVTKLSERNPRSIPQSHSLSQFNEMFRSKVRKAA